MCRLTCFRHALRSLHAGVENFFGRDEKDAVWCLITIHDLKLLYQEIHTAIHVLLPHLGKGRSETFYRWTFTNLVLNKWYFEKCADNFFFITIPNSKKHWKVFFLKNSISWELTHIVHVLWFVCWGIPAVVKDEDVGLRQSFIYFVEKMLFLCVERKQNSNLIIF